MIIGGGIAGISAAARLSHLGQVTLLEAEVGLGYHTSGRSAAMFEETYGSPSTIALNRGSREYLRCANGGVLSPRGLMLVGADDTRSAFARDMDVMSMQPMSIDVAMAKVPILNPNTVTEVGYHAGAWDIDTDLLIQNFSREVRQFGGKVLTGHRVTEIRRDTHGWTVICGAGEFSAKILVNAAGAWVDEVAVMAFGVYTPAPFRGSGSGARGAGHIQVADVVWAGRSLVRQARCWQIADFASRGRPRNTPRRLARGFDPGPRHRAI